MGLSRIIFPIIGPPKLERGKSTLNPASHRGRTLREAAKNARTAARAVARGHASKADQAKPRG